MSYKKLVGRMVANSVTKLWHCVTFQLTVIYSRAAEQQARSVANVIVIWFRALFFVAFVTEVQINWELVA